MCCKNAGGGLISFMHSEKVVKNVAHRVLVVEINTYFSNLEGLASKKIGLFIVLPIKKCPKHSSNRRRGKNRPVCSP
jgi:hypothetical protein